MAVIWSKEDGHVKIYEMASGVEGTELTPTNGWLFVQDITLSESSQTRDTDRIGANYGRSEILNRRRNLSIGKWHNPNAGTDDFLIGIDPAKEYILKIYLYDEREGETEASGTLYTLKHCRPKDKNLTTGNINQISRKWFVGSIE